MPLAPLAKSATADLQNQGVQSTRATAILGESCYRTHGVFIDSPKAALDIGKASLM